MALTGVTCLASGLVLIHEFPAAPTFHFAPVQRFSDLLRL